MSNIALRTTGAVSSRPDAGASSHVNDVNFTGTVLEFADLPSQFASGGTQLVKYAPTAPVSEQLTIVAEMAWQLDKARRRGTDVVQRRMGWRAHHRGIELLTVDRLLVKGSDGKFRPNGQWELFDRRSLSNKPVVRQATFGDPSATITRASVSGEPEPGSAGSGEHAMSYLPEPVRMSLRHNVENPSFNEGEVVQVTGASGVRHEVCLLRSDNRGAVAVKALRAQNGLWTVTMATYRGSID